MITENKFEVGDIVSVQGEVTHIETYECHQPIRIHVNNNFFSITDSGRYNLDDSEPSVTFISRPKKKTKIKLYGWKYRTCLLPELQMWDIIPKHIKYPDRWTRVPGADFEYEVSE